MEIRKIINEGEEAKIFKRTMEIKDDLWFRGFLMPN
jgi:hypothetical protein